MRLDSNAMLADDPLPTRTHIFELTPVYEGILPEKQKIIEIQENIAYGPLSQPKTLP